MPQTLETTATERGTISFQLERFELVDGDHLELTGRWFGVRGRRFIRPTLTLHGEGSNARLLAELYHKPWSAEEGESWEAWFPFNPDRSLGDTVELAVAPDIAVDLPTPGGKSRRGVRAAPAAPPRPSRAVAHRDPVDEQLERLRREVQELRDERVQLKRSHDNAIRERGAATAERDEAIAERDEAIAKRSRVARMLEREREQRSSIVDALERARTERASLERALERAVSERDAAPRTNAPTPPPPDLASLPPAPAPPPPALAPPTPAPPALLVRALAIGVLIAAATAVLIVLQSA